MNAETLAMQLEKPQKVAEGKYIACCPAHDDKKPSLSITQSGDEILFYCHAGCSQTEVLDAFKARGLWNRDGINNSPAIKAKSKWQPLLPVPNDAPKPPTSHYRHGSPSLVWQYLSKDKELLFLVCRFDLGNGAKEVLPLTFCTNGGKPEWKWKAITDNRPLYGLETINNHKKILVCEGEKATDAARRIIGDSLPVVTWSGGSNATSKTAWQPLANKHVVIWPDNDSPGFKAALSINRELLSIGTESIRFIAPPENVKEGWDLADAEQESISSKNIMQSIQEALPFDEFQARFMPEGLIDSSAENSEWEKPLIFGERTPPEIPAALLPSWLSEYVKALSESTQTPPGLAVMLSLSVVATCLQKRFDISPNGSDYREPLNIWTAIALPPASRKTAVISALTAPLCTWEKERVESMADLIRENKTKRAGSKKRIEALSKKAANKDDPGEREKLYREIVQMEKDTPEEIHPPRLWTSDVTPERLQMLLAEHDERMALLSDEGGIFEIMAGLYSDGRANLDVFLQAHAGQAVRVDRASREAYLNAPALTFGLAIQPAIIAELSQGNKKHFRGNGSLARFLYCLPVNNIGTRDVRKNTPIPESIKAAYQAQIFNLLDIKPNHDTNGIEHPRQLCLDPDALESWLTFSQYIEDNQGPNAKFETFQDWTGKLPGAALRIAGLLHVVEHGTSTLTVNQSSMENALDLAELLIEHAKAAFDLMGADESDSDAKAVFKWLVEKRMSSFTRQECHNALQSRFKKVDRLKPALAVLEERAIACQQPAKATGGRPSIAYDVNPAIHLRGAC